MGDRGPKKGQYKIPAEEMNKNSIAAIDKAVTEKAKKKGIWSEEMRERLRPIVYGSAVLLENILSGKPVTEGNPDPTANEVVNAFKAVAPYVMSELKPVMDDALCRVVADVLAEDERIPFECIGDVVDKLITRLNDGSSSS